MIKRLVLLTWLLATFYINNSFSQSKADLRDKFYDAESWILFEDYNEALPIYLDPLLKNYPDNSNIKYRIGQCYINIPGEKDKAIAYLEDAVKNINPKYKEGKFNESGAPYDALYYLANAYRINNQLDKALETYGLFKQNLDPEVYDSTIVNLQIQSCLNAKELMSMPLYIKEVNLGNSINETRSEFSPVISDNEDMLVFARKGQLQDFLLYSTKTNGQWNDPINMNGLLTSDIPGLVDNLIYPTSLSKDGKDLYLYSSLDYDGMIFTTHFENGRWSPLIKLNDNINTKFWESHATISHDNKKLYFTSNRKGGIGNLDIYVSSIDSTGNWGPAVNLGPVINTPHNEESPFLSKDDKTLFFSSRGHFNMGGYDIFYSTLLDNGEWSIPLNVGYPLNSTDDDVFFKPLNEGYEGYYAKDSPLGFGQEDIYRIEIFSENHPRKFFVRGMVKVADMLSYFKDSVKIRALNIKNPNQTVIVYSNAETGEYEFELPQGNYELSYEAKGGEKVVKELDLPLLSPSDSFVIPGTVLPKTDYTADLYVQSNNTISVQRGDSILFPLKVEPNSILTVEHWLGESLISVEKFNITDSLFVYKLAPGVGDNKVVFKLTDRFNNQTTTDVFITREPLLSHVPIARPEYRRVIANKQIEALMAMLISRSDEKLKKVITGSNMASQQFGRVDDLISFVKEEAAKKSISPEEVDKLALRVSVMDNVLTQAAVNLTAEYADGNLKKILDNLDIYEENLKTWTDLQNYILEITDGQITPEMLNIIANYILTDIDPSISVLREKILAYAESSELGDLIKQAVAATELSNIKLADKWLQTFYNEAIKLGITKNQMAELLASISSFRDTDAEQFIKELIQNSDASLASSLESLNLNKEKIKTPGDLISYLLSNEGAGNYTEEAIIKALVNIIASKDIPVQDIISSGEEKGKSKLWFIWIVLGAGLFYILFIYWKKSRKEQK